MSLPVISLSQRFTSPTWARSETPHPWRGQSGAYNQV